MSNRKTAGLLAALALGWGLLLSACGGHGHAAVYVDTPPPPPVAETIVASPGPDFVWIGGFHRWNGSTYVWVPGRWERHPEGRRTWEPGHWRHGGHGYFWVEGRWR